MGKRAQRRRDELRMTAFIAATTTATCKALRDELHEALTSLVDLQAQARADAATCKALRRMLAQALTNLQDLRASTRAAARVDAVRCAKTLTSGSDLHPQTPTPTALSSADFQLEGQHNTHVLPVPRGVT
jgi:hypothetical protein